MCKLYRSGWVCVRQSLKPWASYATENWIFRHSRVPPAGADECARLHKLSPKIDWGSPEWQKVTLNQVTVVAPFSEWYAVSLAKFLIDTTMLRPQQQQKTHSPLRVMALLVPRAYLVSIENCATHNDANAYFHISGRGIEAFPLLEDTHCCKVTYHLLPPEVEESISQQLEDPSVG